MYHPTCHPHLPLRPVLPHGAAGQGLSAPQARKLQLLYGGPKIQRDCVPARAPFSVCSNVGVQLHVDKAWECSECHGSEVGLRAASIWAQWRRAGILWVPLTVAGCGLPLSDCHAGAESSPSLGTTVGLKAALLWAPWGG